MQFQLRKVNVAVPLVLWHGHSEQVVEHTILRVWKRFRNPARDKRFKFPSCWFKCNIQTEISLKEGL